VRADSGSSGLLSNKIDCLKNVAKQRRLDNGKNLLGAWISWQFENGSAVLDNCGGLRPTGAGKPGGLGCGT